jgi:hypothetical protein
MATTTSAVSDAMQLESDLKSWADQKRKEGKLNNQDILEIFPEGYSLALGGENPNNNFREMIEDISKRNPLPVLPGFVSIAIGAFGLFTTATTQKADPDAVGNG